MTVLALIGILSSLAVPRIDFQGYAVRGEVRAVGSTLLRAQRRAVQQQHGVIVAFDVDAGQIRVHDDVNGNLLIDGSERVTIHQLGEGVRLARGTAPAAFASDGDVTFSTTQAGIPAVIFQRNGSASEEGGFYLTSARAMSDSRYAGDTRSAEIQRSTGRPHWMRYGESGWQEGG